MVRFLAHGMNKDIFYVLLFSHTAAPKCGNYGIRKDAQMFISPLGLYTAIWSNGAVNPNSRSFYDDSVIFAANIR